MSGEHDYSDGSRALSARLRLELVDAKQKIAGLEHALSLKCAECRALQLRAEAATRSAAVWMRPTRRT
jgi:hypothetical protein